MVLTELFVWAILAAFILQFFDASIGMGYGEIVPLLLIFGFAPLEVVPAVLLTSAIMSLFAGYLHHDFKNVNFKFSGKDFRLVTILTIFGIIGIFFGVFLAVEIPENVLKTYIGIVVIAIGILVLLKKEKRYQFSWKKIIGLGTFASVNKGLTGGGYGPVLAGGQIVAGVDSKKAVGVTALTEGIVSTFGFFSFFLVEKFFHKELIFNFPLIFALLLGGLVATPLAVYATKKIKADILKDVVGVVGIILGIVVLAQLIF